MFELLKEWKLINSSEDFQSIIKDKKSKDQLYGYVQSHGGVRKVRQSIRPKQPPPPPVVSIELYSLRVCRISQVLNRNFVLCFYKSNEIITTYFN